MTPEQSAILSTLAYSGALHDEVHPEESIDECKSLADYLVEVDEYGDRTYKAPAPDGFPRDQWEDLIDEALKDDVLLRLKVGDITTNTVDKGAMITLVDPKSKQAIIVYQGTAGPEGWDQDFKSGYSLTESQRKAKAYADAVAVKYSGEYYIYATGHSKGGNEAALVAVECDGIDCAFAFDAPGNGQAYFDDPDHARKAKLNAHRVTYYSNENCFVSPLNPRYDTSEYWLRSGQDAWAGHEELKAILAFSPWAHAPEHLFDGDYAFDYVDGPASHLVEMNRFTRWLEKNLPHDDCACVLDAIGRLVASLTDKEKKWTLQEIIQEFIAVLDPRALAILLVAIEDYPYSEELLGAIFAPDVLELIPTATKYIGFVGTRLGNTYVMAVEFWQGVTRTKMAVRNVSEGVNQLGKTVNAFFHTHDFTEQKLAMLEAIVSSFKASPLVLVYNGWKSLFGGSGFFAWINLSFVNPAVVGIGALLDHAIDEGLRSIRDKFHQAWEADSNRGSALGKAREPLEQAAQTLQTILR